MVKEVSTSILMNLVWETPVDTSKALSNWQAGQTYDILDEIDAYFEGIFGSTEAASSQMAFDIGKKNIKRKLYGTVLYISNNVDYIESLNRGSSGQAPAGYVDSIVSRGRRAVKNKKLFK